MAEMETVPFLSGGTVKGEGHYGEESMRRDDVSSYLKPLNVNSLGR